MKGGKNKMVKTYTEKYKGFQIRDINYLDDPPDDEPIMFDVVQWCEDAYSGKEYCWSVARLIYDDKEPCFDLQSVGLRWVEAHPPREVEDWIIKWCDYKLRELDSDNY